MPQGVGEELASIQIKVGTEIVKQGAEVTKEILKMLLKNDSLKGGKNSLKKLVNSKGSLHEIKVAKEDLKEILQKSKKEIIPVAPFKTADGDYKIVFRQEDMARIESLLKDTIAARLEKEETKDNVEGKPKVSLYKEEEGWSIEKEGESYYTGNKEPKEIADDLREKFNLNNKEIKKLLKKMERKSIGEKIQDTKQKLGTISPTRSKTKEERGGR